jgi:hypothetical protein
VKLTPEGRVQIYRNRGRTMEERRAHRAAGMVGREVPRWKHGTLPQYRGTDRWGPTPTGKKLHLFWIGPIFVCFFPARRDAKV